MSRYVVYLHSVQQRLNHQGIVKCERLGNEAHKYTAYLLIAHCCTGFITLQPMLLVLVVIYIIFFQSPQEPHVEIQECLNMAS